MATTSSTHIHMLSRLVRITLLLTASCLAGCQYLVPRTLLDTDMLANYERVFGHRMPGNVDVVRSRIVDYWWPTIIIPDAWCFEILAPRTWIDRILFEWELSPGRPGWISVERFPDWYAPAPLESYAQFHSYLTSIAYVHVLVCEEQEPDSRYRVFLGRR